MSAQSVQAYVNWVKQSDSINSQASVQLNSITSQLNALNPGNPNSTAQLSALQKQAQAIVNSRDSQLAALGPPPNPANLTERERAQVGAQIGLNAGNGLIDYRNALDSLQSAGAAAQRNIKTTQSAGTSRGQTVPVTTGDGTSKPVTNVAASANTTTRTTVTNTTNTTATVRANTTVTSNSVTRTTVTNTTNTTATTGGTARTVTAPVPVERPEPIALLSESLSPTIRMDPITVDTPTFDSRGRQTGTTQTTIEFPPTPEEPIAVTLEDPGPLATPLIDSDELTAIAAQAAADGAAAVEAAANPFQARTDWRVRLALSDAPEVNYLYKAPNPGILKPLNATNGVLFPYTPTITVNYTAGYNPTELVHSNYKVYQYSSSSVDSINIQCEFTAQDEYEANYLLAVIHFFRSATKMFYGQDESPRRGTPPPLCYIYGMGSYQFSGQPLAIQSFSYNLPNNVDYIQTSVGTDTTTATPPTTQPGRMEGTGVARGGVLPPPQFAPIAEPDTVSWVPSKIQLAVQCVPMMNRNSVSNEFSLEKYATGSLLNGVGKTSGGFW